MRYAAFLRGVMPTNARMSELVECFEAAGFTEVRTVLSSGNVLFQARASSLPSLERRAEAAMRQRLGRSFLTLVRPLDRLRTIVASDPYRGFRLGAGAKRIVTFLRQPPTPLPRLPIEADGARILCLDGTEAFSAYLRTPRGPVFMTLIERTFGIEQTTRTWETVRKLAS